MSKMLLTPCFAVICDAVCPISGNARCAYKSRFFCRSGPTILHERVRCAASPYAPASLKVSRPNDLTALNLHVG